MLKDGCWVHLLRVILNLFLSWIEGIICLVTVYYISSVKAGFAYQSLIPSDNFFLSPLSLILTHKETMLLQYLDWEKQMNFAMIFRWNISNVKHTFTTCMCKVCRIFRPYNITLGAICFDTPSFTTLLLFITHEFVARMLVIFSFLVLNLLQIYLSPPQKRHWLKPFQNLVKLLKVTTVTANPSINVFFRIDNL